MLERLRERGYNREDKRRDPNEEKKPVKRF
jgi:hypothetical protein